MCVCNVLTQLLCSEEMGTEGEIEEPDIREQAPPEETETEEAKLPAETPMERPRSRPLVRRDKKYDLFADEGQSARPASGEQFPPKRANLLSRALSLLKKKSPPQDSILSSVIGFYGAQATMLTAAVIGERQASMHILLPTRTVIIIQYIVYLSMYTIPYT